jgi:hypothetical protein
MVASHPAARAAIAPRLRCLYHIAVPVAPCLMMRGPFISRTHHVAAPSSPEAVEVTALESTLTNTILGYRSLCGAGTTALLFDVRDYQVAYEQFSCESMRPRLRMQREYYVAMISVYS